MSHEPHDPLHTHANGEEPPRTRRIVLFSCAMAIVVFIGAVGVLYSGWIGHENPNGLIIVQGDSSLSEAVVTLRPLNHDTRSSLRAQFKNGVDNRLRFHVPQGRYEISVQGAGLQFRPTAVDAMAQPIIVELAGASPSSQPHSRAVK